MIRRPPRSTQSRSSAASDVYKRQQPSQGAARPRQPLARSPVALPHQGYVLRRNHPRRQPQPRPGTAHRAEKTSRLRKRLTKGVSPLNPRQILLVNLATDLFPAMAIAMRPPLDRSPERLLREGPEVSLGHALTRDMAVRATTTAGGATAAWLVARATGRARRAQTVGLIALVGTQLGQTLVAGGRSPVVLGTSALSAGALAAVVQTPGISSFFGCTPVGPAGWAIAGVSAATATAAA